MPNPTPAPASSTPSEAQERAVQTQEGKLHEEREAIRQVTQVTLDKSYHEEAETRQGKVKIAWAERVGQPGGYVITFPATTEGEAEKKLWVGARPKLAKSFFKDVAASLNALSVDRLIEGEQEFLDQYDPDYLWSQDERMEHPDINYHEALEADGLRVDVGWNRNSKAFELTYGAISPYTTPDVREKMTLGRSTDDAKAMFKFAAEQLEQAKGDEQALIGAIRKKALEAI